MKTLVLACCLLATGKIHAESVTENFRHVGDYVLKSRTKITAGKSIDLVIKPMLFRVFTNGLEIRVIADNDPEAKTTFEVYRSDGIGLQRRSGGPIEIIPGVQAYSRAGGVLRHLRLSKEALTITMFPGVSDQTVITHAIGVETTAAPATPLPAPPQDETASS